eukprot:scaffold73593_cov39-Prasinocladus_malaysianus.AAC.1
MNDPSSSDGCVMRAIICDGRLSHAGSQTIATEIDWTAHRGHLCWPACAVMVGRCFRLCAAALPRCPCWWCTAGPGCPPPTWRALSSWRQRAGRSSSTTRCMRHYAPRAYMSSGHMCALFLRPQGTYVLRAHGMYVLRAYMCAIPSSGHICTLLRPRSIYVRFYVLRAYMVAVSSPGHICAPLLPQSIYLCYYVVKTHVCAIPSSGHICALLWRPQGICSQCSTILLFHRGIFTFDTCQALLVLVLWQ